MLMKAYQASKRRQQRDIACLGAKKFKNTARKATGAPNNVTKVDSEPLKSDAEEEQCKNEADDKKGKEGPQIDKGWALTTPVDEVQTADNKVL